MSCIGFQLPDGTRGIVTVGGPIRKIAVRGRLWHFEMHSYFGPMVCHKRTGAGIDAPMYVWDALTLWHQQGQRLDETGVAIWDPPPPPPPLYKIGRGQYTEDPKLAAKCGVTEPIPRIERKRRGQ